MDLKIRFFDASSAGNQLGAEVDLAGVTLTDGVFQLALDSAALQKIFAANLSVYIEVTDVTDKKTYPRQAFQAVPYALHVPVDGTSITYDNNGLLTVPAPAAVTPPTAGSSQSGYLATSDWVQFNAAPPKTYVDSLNTAQVASVAALSTGLTTTNSNLTTTSNAVTTLNGAALKKDGSVPLTATWNVGGQDITNTGNLQMVGSKTLGLSVANSDPGGLTNADAGKIWYNGGIRLWNGTSAQSLGIANAGVLSLNGDNNGAQTVAAGIGGTTLNVVDAGNVHTVRAPMANAGGTITAGLISNPEWVLFNGKQPLLGNASAATSGILTNMDWSLFNGKQPLLSPAAPTVSGYLASTDWVAFNAKQPAGSYVATTRNVNTTGPLAGGGNLGADLTLSIAPATLAASGYLSSSDWAAFNAKDPARTTGNLAETTSNVLTISGGANSVIGAGTTIAVTKATGAAAGYLTAADWTAFNNKQSSPWGAAGTSLYYGGNSNTVGIGTTASTARLEVNTSGSVAAGASNTTFPTPFAVTGNYTTSAGPYNNATLTGMSIAPNFDTSGAATTGHVLTGLSIAPVRSGNLGHTTIYGLNVSLNSFALDSPYAAIFNGGNVGIGTSAPTANLQINSTGGTTADIVDIDSTNTTAAQGIVGLRSMPTQSIGTGFAYGLLGQPLVTATSGTVSNAYGVAGSPLMNGTGGTITNAYGVFARVDNQAGTITNAYASYIAAPFYNTGTTTNRYALVVESGAGNVGIGTTSPASPLTVNGTIESTSGGVKFPDGTTQATSATNPVGFSSYGSAQSIATGTYVTIANPTVVFDKTGAYNTGTGAFTTPTAGVFNCVCQADYEAMGGTAAAPIDVFVGFVSTGTVPDISQRSMCASSSCASNASINVLLAASGTVSCRTWQASGSPKSLNASRTFFSCYRLGP